MQIRVLGTTELADSRRSLSIGSERQRRLLSVLAMRSPRTVPADLLIEVVWAEVQPENGVSALRTVVTRLRQTLDGFEPGAGQQVRTRPPGYALEQAGSTIDANEFADLVTEGRRALAEGEVGPGRELLGEALRLWTGPAYAEFRDEQWAQADAIRLEQLWIAAREGELAARLALGEHDEAIGDIERLIADEPLSDGPRALLMRAEFAAGRQASALRHFQAYRRTLADEAGLEPGRDLRDLEARILQGDPTLLPQAGRALRGYRLHERLSITEQGEVFRATQPGLERDVAVEVIPAELANDAAFVRSFQTRSQSIAQLGHVHVVRLFDCWRDPSGAYLVSQLLSGGSLADAEVVDRLGSVGLDRVRDQIRSALDVAHQSGLVHGPIEAGDVQLDEHDNAYLANFRFGSTRASVADDDRSFSALFAGLLGPSPFARPSAPTRMGNPYRALSVFTEADVDVFFGRGRLVQEVLATLERQRVAFVVGPSGSGKSSVVRAGVVPALAAGELPGSEEWFTVSMTPGARPFEELEAAVLRVAVHPPATLLHQLRDPNQSLARTIQRVLPDPGSAVVLVVDQFEELFTLADDDERDAFLGALATALGDRGGVVRLVATLRADYYDAPLSHPTVAGMCKRATVAVDALSGDELRAAIVEPARIVGVTVEPDLVACLVADSTGHAGGLPLLQYTLTRLFDTRDHDEMTLEAYLSLGGIAGAIGTRAEEVYGQLAADEREICRRMFGRLIAISGAATDTRRRVRVGELRAVEATAVEQVVGPFVDARLLALDRDDSSREPTVEVAHEALFREWPRLRAWITDDRQTIAALRHLNAATETWKQTGYDSELYRGARLAGALDLMEHHADRLTPDEGAFVEASRALAEREAVAQRRQNRRLRLLLSLTGMLLVIALVAGSVAFVKADQADSRAHDAHLARAAADVDRLVAVSRSEGTPRDVAALAALEAHRLSPSATTRNALHEAITADPTYRGSLTTSPVLDLASAPSGERVVAAAPTTIDVYDVGTRSQVASWPVPGGAPLASGDIRLALSEDASVVAAATPAGTSVHDASTGEVVLIVPGSATTVALSADSTSIAVGREGGVVEVWDLDDAGGPVAQTAPVGGDGVGVAELAWHPDGGTIAIGISDGDVVLWQIGRDASVWQIDGEPPVGAPADARSRLGPRAVFTADGRRLVVATYFAAATDRSTRQVQEIRVYDMETRAEHRELRRPWSEYAAPFLSWARPDQGMLLAVGSANAALIEVGVSTTADGLPNPQVATFAGHPNVRAASALSDDLIAVGTARGIELRSLRSGNVAVRRVAPPTEQQHLVQSGGYGFVFAALDHGGDRVLAQWGGPAHINPGRPEVLDLTRSGAEWEPFALADGSTPFFVLPVGVNLLVFDGVESEVGPRVATWDSAPTGPAVASLDSVYRGRTPDVSLSGHRLYLGGLTDDLLADTATGRDVLRLPGVDSETPFTDARFSTDGALFTRPDGRGGTEVYDATSGAPIPFEHQLEARLFGPRGTWFAVAEPSGTVRLHDQVTGEPVGSPMVGHDGIIKNFVPSPDGTRFLTAGLDGTTRVWDVGSTSQVGRTIAAGSATTWWLGWSGDGRFVVVSPTGNADPDLDRIEIWNFDDESWPSLACEVAGRNLTEAEWADFGPRTMQRRATCEQYAL